MFEMSPKMKHYGNNPQPESCRVEYKFCFGNESKLSINTERPNTPKSLNLIQATRFEAGAFGIQSQQPHLLADDSFHL